MPNDDIPGLTPDTDKPTPTEPRPTVAPESENRGGGETPNRTLGADEAGVGQLDKGALGGRLARPGGDIPDGMPGARADLPEGSLPGPYLETQGDENRDPPPNAPAPVNPAATVETTPRGEERGPKDRT